MPVLTRSTSSPSAGAVFRKVEVGSWVVLEEPLLSSVMLGEGKPLGIRQHGSWGSAPLFLTALVSLTLRHTGVSSPNGGWQHTGTISQTLCSVLGGCDGLQDRGLQPGVGAHLTLTGTHPGLNPKAALRRGIPPPGTNRKGPSPGPHLQLLMGLGGEEQQVGDDVVTARQSLAQHGWVDRLAGGHGWGVLVDGRAPWGPEQGMWSAGRGMCQLGAVPSLPPGVLSSIGVVGGAEATLPQPSRMLPPRDQASSRRRFPLPGAALSPPPAPAAPRPAAVAKEKMGGGGGAEGHVRLHQHPPRPTAPLLSQAETLWSTCCPLTSSSGSTCPPGRRDSRLGAPQSNQHPVFPLPTPAGLTGWHPDVGEDAEGAGAAGEQDAAGAGLQQHGHPCGHPPAPQLGGEGELRLLPQALGGAEGGSLRGG